jgi:hypothetical protein
MNGEWIVANKCPHCGGKLVVREFYSRTREYPISKNGKVSKRGRWATEDSLGLVTVFCNSCRVGWDATHTWVNTDDIVEIRGNGD